MINILFWNMRGMGNHPTREKLKAMIQEFKVDIVAITEPMVRELEINSLSAYLGMPGILSNGSSGGKLWILWQLSLQVNLTCSEEQFCTISILHNTRMLYR